MKKLRLDVHALAVESFEAEARLRDQAGTVAAREATLQVDTCGCPDTTRKGGCFCTESPTCWNCV